jgi:hypothetical protein
MSQILSSCESVLCWIPEHVLMYWVCSLLILCPWPSTLVPREFCVSRTHSISGCIIWTASSIVFSYHYIVQSDYSGNIQRTASRRWFGWSRFSSYWQSQGDLLVDFHNILNRWKNCFSQLLNLHRLSDIRQMEILVHTAKPSTFELLGFWSLSIVRYSIN